MESAPKALLAEWLAQYFDGAEHAVGSNDPVPFPKCYLAFNGSPRVQPLSNLGLAERVAPIDGEAECEIRVVCLPVSETDTFYGAGKLATSVVLFNFWITAKAAAEGDSELLAQNAAQLLKALLSNPATAYELAQKGVTHVEPRPPEPLPNVMGAMRLVACRSQLQFEIAYTL